MSYKRKKWCSVISLSPSNQNQIDIKHSFLSIKRIISHLPKGSFFPLFFLPPYKTYNFFKFINKIKRLLFKLGLKREKKIAA